MARIAAPAASFRWLFRSARPPRGPSRRRARLLLAIALLAAPACSRGLVRIPPDNRAEAGSDARSGPLDGSPIAVADPLPADRCDPLGLLPLVPHDVPGWTADPGPVFPYEIFAGTPVGFTGRLFRADSGCVVVGVSRPADVEDAVKALTVERPRTVDVGGRHGMVFPSLSANQVTTWVRDGADRLFLLRAYGTVDPDVLQPFLDAVFPPPAGEGDDASADGVSPATPSEPADGGEAPDCSGRYPIAYAYDPATFWGPPGDCWQR